MNIAPSELVRLLRLDDKTGDLVWIGGRRAGRVAGSIHAGYVRIAIGRKRLMAHRVVFAIAHGRWPEGSVDHIDGSRKNNRPSNLREASPAVNCQNTKKAKSTNRTGLLGVTARQTGYQARITTNGVTIRLGTFRTASEAHSAYERAKRRLHPESRP